MRIDCYISHGCGSEEALKQNINSTLEAEKMHADVVVHRIDDAQAREMRLSGSPSVFINGKELQPSGAPGFS